MKLRLFVVGRVSSDLMAVEARYLKYLKSYADITVRELPQGRGRHAVQRMSEEEHHILKHAPAGFILFDVLGKTMRSEQWAEYLERAPSSGVNAFVIGGADGVSLAVREKSAQQWSLSALTLPHQLVRVLVLEQLYRATSLLHGHPYHRA
ncbi:MAG: 23S rRNA (pseudouridine(1915)-N(3))-methyltransferase RlmH [Mariprofundaceae bacterium]